MFLNFGPSSAATAFFFLKKLLLTVLRPKNSVIFWQKQFQQWFTNRAQNSFYSVFKFSSMGW